MFNPSKASRLIAITIAIIIISAVTSQAASITGYSVVDSFLSYFGMANVETPQGTTALLEDGLTDTQKSSPYISSEIVNGKEKEEAGNNTPDAISAVTYPFTTSSGATLEDMTSGATSLIASGSDDGASALSNIGFEFFFNGARYTQFGASSNGYFRLGGTVNSPGTAVDYGNSLGNANQPPVIAPYWDDLATGTTGSVVYKVLGSAPNRKMVVQWFVTVPIATGGTANAKYQAWLYETTGAIEFVYGSGMVTNTGGASIGFASASGVLASITLNATTTLSTCSYSTAKNDNTIATTAGTKFSFTPSNTPAAPTAPVFSNVGTGSLTLTWTDIATNELGFPIYISTDNINFSYLGQVGSSAGTGLSTGAGISGLLASTTYYFKVYAVAEGILSTALDTVGQSTTAPIGGLTALDAPKAENFNGLPSAGPSPFAWTDNVTVPSHYASDTTYTVGTGSSNSGGLYSFGIAGANPVSERALGTLAASSTPRYMAVKLTNSTGIGIGSLDVSYNGEQWRAANTSAQSLSFQYQVANVGVITDANVPTSGWTPVSALNFTSPILTTAGPIDGNSVANRTAISSTITFGAPVANGQEIWIRWVDADDTGNDHALAIDDLSVTPHGVPAGPGTVQFSAASYTELEGNVATITANRTGGSSGVISVDYATGGGLATGGGACTAGIDYITPAGTTLNWGDTVTTPQTFTVTLCNDTDSPETESLNLTLSNPIGTSISGTNPVPLNITDVPAMVYSSSTTTQVTGNTLLGGTNQAIIGLQVVTTGSYLPLSATQLNLSTNGSTLPSDIASAKVYYTGTSSTFATGAQFGSTVSSPSGAFSVSGSQALSTGTNYFWLAYDISPTATVDNFVDGEALSIDLSSGNVIPSVTAPAGSRQIKAIVTIPGANTLVGGQRYPLATYYGYQRSASIYTAAELGLTTGSSINSMCWYSNSQSGTAVNGPTKIYLKTTAASTFPVATTVATEETGATLTYDATPALTYAANTWQCIALSNPFVYTGNNLEVIVETNYTGGGSGEGSAGKVMRYSTAASAHQFWEADTTPPSGVSTTWSVGGISNNRPNIQFTYTPLVVAPGNLQLSSATYSALEGATLSATVDRVSGSTGSVTVDYTLTDSGGEAALGGIACGGFVDYIYPGTPQTLTFGNSVTSQPINITLCTDTLTETSETFTIALTNPTGGAGLGTPTSAVATIIDNPPGSVQFSAPAFDGNEGMLATITATRTGGSGGAVSVDYATSDTTAIGGASCAGATDYISTSGTLNWTSADAANKTFTVQLCSDFEYSEGPETLSLALSNVTGGASLGLSAATLIITDTGASFCNTAPIVIPSPSATPANLYPSNITVSSLTGVVNSVKVTLNNIQHTYSADLDVLLVSPDGRKFIAMSDVGNSAGFDASATITLSDAGAALLPSAAVAITNGTYKPTNYDADTPFPAPAPAAPYLSPGDLGSATLNGAFGGANPNGTWSLYVYDDAGGDGGTIAGGWCLELTTVPSHDLSVVATNGGTITTPLSSPVTVGEGFSTPIVAAANAGYTFTGWTLTSGTGTTIAAAGDLSTTATMGTTDATVTANFAINQYALTTNGVDCTVARAPDQALYDSGTIVLLTATPTAGYHFVDWTGDLTSSTNPDSITMDAAKSVTANCAINTYTLTYNAGSEGYIEGDSPQVVNHGGSGTPVTAIPLAPETHHFVNWTPGGSTNPTRTDTNVTSDLTFDANFAINNYAVMFNSNGGSSVSQQDIDHGDFAVAPAAPTRSGFTFGGWYTDDITFANAFNFATTPITGAITLHAKWVANVETSVDVSMGNLVVTDGNGGTSNDNLTILCNGLNIRIHDPSNTLTAGSGATQVDANTVDVPIASISGSITIDTLEGDDTLTIDLQLCNIVPAGGIIFNGGDNSVPMRPDGAVYTDRLIIQGGDQGAVTYNYTNANDGNVVMANFGTISYTGLEPIMNTGTSTDVIFNLPAATNVATLSDQGGGMTRLDSTGTFELTDFTTPTGSITVNRGSAADMMSVGALGAGFPSLTLGTSIAQFASISFSGAVPLAVDKSLAAFSTGTISLSSGSSDLTTSGTGTIALTTATNISTVSGASIATVNGNVDLSANQQVSATTGTFAGVMVNGSIIESTGSGVVTVYGRGGTVGAGNPGVIVLGGGSIRGGTTSGVMTTDVRGTGGSGGSNPHGIDIQATASITSLGGNVRVRGFGGTSTSANNYGVIPVNGGLITSGGNGDVLVEGTGGSNASGGNVGVIPHQGGTITSGGTGTVTVNGFGGNGPDSFGIQIYRNGRITSGGVGTVTVAGVATNGFGVFVNALDNNIDGARINSGGGAISVTGTGSGGLGVVLGGGGKNTISSVSNANISLIGNGIVLDGSGTNAVNAGSGAVSIRQLTTSTAISLGGSDGAGVLGLTDDELDRVTAGTLNIGNGFSGSITVTGNITRSASTVVGLTTGGDVNITSLINTAGGNLTTTATGTVTAAKTGVDVNTGVGTYAVGSQLSLSIGGNVADTSYQQLNVAGLVNITGTTLTLSGGYVPVAGDAFTVVENDGMEAITGTFTGLPEGTMIPNFHGSLLTATITYVGGSGNDAVITIPLPIYTLSVVSTNGTVTSSPLGINCGADCTENFTSGTGVQLTASPIAGYHFVNWTGNVSSVSNPVSFTMDANKAVTANFAINEYTLTYTAGGGGSIVGISPQMVNHGANGTLVTATPNSGYHFVSWSDGYPTAARTDMNVMGNVTAMATFAINEYTLTLNATNGAIDASPTPVGGTYPHGTVVSLHPDPANGYYFSGFTGDCVTSNPFCTVTMDGDKTVTASYTASVNADMVRDFNGVTNTAGRDWQYGYSETDGSGFTRYVDVLDTFGGTIREYRKLDSQMAVVQNTTGANLNYNSCTLQQPDVLAMFPGVDARKTMVRWTAPASGAYQIDGRFQDIDQGSSDVSVIKNGDTVTPIFVESIVGGGCNATTITKPFSAAVILNAGDTIDFRVGYGGNGNAFDGTGVAATVTPIAQQVLTVSHNGNGSIASSPAGIDCGSTCSAGFDYGTVVTLTATPDAGYHLTGWSGETCSGTGTCVVTMDQARTVSATFAVNAYTITASAGTGGTITPSGSVAANFGDTPTFTITANGGYSIADVLVDGASVGAVGSYMFTAINANHTIAASFTQNTYTITATAGAGGSISPSGSVVVSHGASQAFTITATTGYHIVDVLVDGVPQGAISGYTFMNVTANGHTISATFALNEYPLTVTTAGTGSGTVSKSPDQATYHYGDMVTLTPSANPGSTFTGWSGACSGSGACVVTIDGTDSVTATFTLIEYALTVATDGTGSGTVSKSPDQPTYHYGDMVTLTPSAAIGSTFTGWAGACSGSGACVVTIDGTDSVTATFTLTEYTLTVTTAGTGSGTVSKSPDQATYHYGDMVTLIPSANPGSAFTGWSGACTGTGVCVVTIDGTDSVTATFILIEYMLDVTTAGTGSGTVSKSPDQPTYHYGDMVTLTPSAAIGSTFTGWSGACSGSGACVVTIDGTDSVTATFTLTEYTLTVTTAGTGSGTVSKSPDQATYHYGDMVTLIPSANAGSAFTGWSGACTGTGVCVVTIDGTDSVTATFILIEYMLDVTTAGTGSGTVSKSPDQPTYHYGDMVALTPSAAIGSTFTGWSGACTGSGACVVTIDGTDSVTATFTLIVTPATTVYVDSAWAGVPIGDDPDAGGPATEMGYDAFATVEDGVAGVATGGIVIVHPGSYTGNVDINRVMDVRGNFTTTGSLTISAAGASVSPGNSPGLISTGSYTMVSGTTLNIELNGSTTAGVDYDQVDVTGTVDLGGATLAVTTGYTPMLGETYTIVNNDGSDPITGTFAGLAEGATVNAGGNSFSISYMGGTNSNDVVLTSIASSFIVSMPMMTSPTGVDVLIPLNITDTTGGGIVALDVAFEYDPLILAPVFSAGTLVQTSTGTMNTATYTITANKVTSITPGKDRILVGMFDNASPGPVTHPLMGAGTLVYLRMHVNGAAGTNSALMLSSLLLNGGLVDGSDVDGNLAVVASATTTALTSSLNPSTFGDLVTFTATITATPPATVGNGSVSFFVDGSMTPTCTTPVSMNVATCATSALSAGPHSIVAVYSGSIDFETSMGSLTQNVDKAPSVTTVTCPPGTFVYTGAAIMPCSATVTGNGMAVIFGPVALAMGDYTNNVAVGNLTASGMYTFGGDSNYLGSSDTEFFSITSGTITGKVEFTLPVHTGGTYIQPVPDVLLTAVGSVNTSGSTIGDGTYSLTNFGVGPYTVTPTKPTQQCTTSNGIFADDASLVSQHVVGLITLTPQQIAAGKVGNQTTLSSFDAALIAQKVVAICNPNNLAGQWRFAPVSKFFPNVLTTNPNENYAAYIMGDVSGDWLPSGGNRSAIATTGSADAAIASMPKMSAGQGTEVMVPLRIDNLGGKAMTSYQFDVQFDPNVVQPATVAAELTDTMGQNLTVAYNATEPGMLRIAVYGALPVSGDGVYANLRFTVVGNTGSTTPLAITAFRFNHGEDEVIVGHGSIVVAHSSNTGSVNGTLRTATGRAVPNAVVTLIDTMGRTRSVAGDADGNFGFTGLVVGETYTVGVESKRFRFMPVTLSIVDTAMTLDMIAE